MWLASTFTCFCKSWPDVVVSNSQYLFPFFFELFHSSTFPFVFKAQLELLCILSLLHAFHHEEINGWCTCNCIMRRMASKFRPRLLSRVNNSPGGSYLLLLLCVMQVDRVKVPRHTHSQWHTASGTCLCTSTTVWTWHCVSTSKFRWHTLAWM